MNEQPTNEDTTRLVEWYVNELANANMRLARAEVTIVDLRTKVQALETIAAAQQASTPGEQPAH